MRRITIFISLCLLFPLTVSAQGTWVWNNRTHSELHWTTLNTAHFHIHYHQGLRDLAEKTARIAEQTYPVIMAQLDLQDFGKTDITLTAEDEIMNGYAMPSNQIFIWVSQNDVAGQFGGSEKWLRLVVAHEFQHVAMMNALRTWLGIWNSVAIPGWFIEGTAEYYTENWRVGRSDARMKIHTYKNTMNRLDPHDDGYAKVLYLADKYGDSTITKITKWRHKTFKYFDFKQAFKSATGTSLKRFHEDWRRAMHTYYYSYRGQKEKIEDVGEVPPAPAIRHINFVSIAPDSSQIAIVGHRNTGMQYQSLYTITTDSTGKITTLHDGKFGSKPAWSPDGGVIYIGEYHRGDHGSLVYDIRKIDVETGKTTWVTSDLRANHPVVSGDGTVYFIAHPGETTNLYASDGKGAPRQITAFTGDIQLNYPAVSPDNQWIAFMIQDVDGDVDIAVIDSAGNNYQKITHDPAEDLMPVWSADGRQIIFTSFRNSTPNLYRIAFQADDTIYRMTDVTSGVYSQQRVPNSDKIFATTLATVDTPRGVIVDPGRVVENTTIALRDEYQDWRTRVPDSLLPAIDYSRTLPDTWETSDYTFYNNPRHLASLLFPTETGIGGFTVWNDAVGKHLAVLGGEIGYPFYTHSQFLNGLYFVYSVAQWKPFVSFGVLKNSSFMIRPYDHGWLTEIRDGGFLLAEYPFNFGNSLFSNHSVAFQVQLYSRQAEILGNPVGDRPVAENSDESVFTIRYQWINRKPDTRNKVLPRQGYGVAIQYDFTSPVLYGDFNFDRITTDAFINQRLFGPLTLYGRLLYSRQSGHFPQQDSLGFVDDINLYLLGNASWGLALGNFINTYENYTLRGYPEAVFGEQLLTGNLELRVPLLPALPVHIFGMSVGKTVTAPYVDYGTIWRMNHATEIITTGIEFRTEVRLAKMPVFHIGYGAGNTLQAWQQETAPHYFARIALVNPF